MVLAVCEKFGFHQTFINLNKEPQARVRVNGILSKTFNLKRGTRQGDPLSPQLFALYIEPLAERIRVSENIKGLLIKEDEQKLAMYVDDIIVYLTDIHNSLPALLDEVGNYGILSGYKLNLNKTEAMVIGTHLERDFKKQFDFKWDQNKVRYLGVIIPNNLDLIYHCNFGNLENLVKQDLNRWKILPLTLFEKINIIKMNILPCFLFLFQNFPTYIPPTSFNVWDGLLRKFLWGRKEAKSETQNYATKKRKRGTCITKFD